jgi:hypothetical protein
MPNADDVMRAANRTGQRLAQETDKHLIRMRKSIRNLQQRMTNELKNLTTNDKGKLMGPRVNLKQAQKVHQSLINQFDEEFGEVQRRGLTKSFNNIADQIAASFKDLDITMDFTGVDRDMIAMLRNQALDQFEAYGQQAMDQMATAMYDTVIARGTFAELVGVLDGILIGGVDARGQSMAQYSSLWASEAIMNYQQSVHLKKGRDAGLKHYLYFGNIMERSRPFCIDRAGKVFSEEQILSWNDMKWQGKSGPPLTNRGGWNCRHHWQPVKKEWIPEEGLDIGDYFDETGAQPGVARGSTMPNWPGPGAKGKKPQPPKPPPRKPIQFGDPAVRWVPPDGFHSDTNEWLTNFNKAGRDYHKWSGLNPSGPVADNIVEALEAQGRNGRVLQTTFRNVLDPAVENHDKMFTHFVAVELDDSGRIIRIFDPVNNYRYRAGLRGIEDIAPDAKLPEYWPTFADDLDAQRMQPKLFKKGEWARDTSSLYSMDDHAFFYDKMDNPAVARYVEALAVEADKKAAALKKAAAEAAEEAGDIAPGTKTAQVGFKPWKPAKTKAAAKKQMQDIIDECNRRDTYPRVHWGDDEGAHYIRFRHDPTHWKWRDAALKPHSWKAERLHAKIKISGKTSLDELNAINRKLAEFQERLSLYELPPLRGAFTWAQKSGWAANMGDGVMGLHHDAFGSWFGDLIFDKAKYVDNLKKTVGHQQDLLKTIAAVEGKNSKAYKVVKEQLDLRKAELTKLAEDTWEGPIYGNRKSKATKWRPGDDTSGRPDNMREYFSNYADKGYKTMEHELGHHIHQQLFVDGNTASYDDPPFEVWLQHFFQNTPHTRNNIRTMAASKYALKNSHEWFAENYCAWHMNMKHLVNEELVGVLEGLDDLASGKITARQLKHKMFDEGDFARPIIPAAKQVYKETAEMVEEIDDLYYKVLATVKDSDEPLSAFTIKRKLEEQYGDTVFSFDVDKILARAANEGLVGEAPGGWAFSGPGAKAGAKAVSKYKLPGTFPMPSDPSKGKTLLDMWDAMVEGSRSVKPVSVADLVEQLGVEEAVADTFMRELRAYDLVTHATPKLSKAHRESKFFIRRASQYKR